MWPFKKKTEPEPPQVVKSEPPTFPGCWQRVYVCSACGGIVDRLGEVVCPHCGEDNSPFSPSVGRPWRYCVSFSGHMYTSRWELREPKEDKFQRLKKAVSDVYYAGHWSCDRSVDEVALWTALRDTAEFEPGNSPKSEM